VVAALRSRPEVAAESLIADLEESARNLLTELLVEDDPRFSQDVEAAIGDYRRQLERQQHRRRQLAIARRIGEGYLAAEPVTPSHEVLAALHTESKAVYEMSGGVAQSLEPRDLGPQGVQTHE
jgi:hypothetical protein